MTQLYPLPTPLHRPAAEPATAYLVASGDLRPSANLRCWPTQQRLEADVTAALAALHWKVSRAHPFDAEKGHGFIDSQRIGEAVSRELEKDPTAPLIMGVDIARHGEDQTVIRFRRGLDARSVPPPVKFRGP